MTTVAKRRLRAAASITAMVVAAAALFVAVSAAWWRNHVASSHNTAATSLLCRRGTILLGLVDASIGAIHREPHPDLELLRQFQRYRIELSTQLTNKESPCYLRG